MAPRLDLLVVADSLDGGLGAFAGAHARWFAEQGWRVGLASSMAHSAELAPAEGIHLDMPDAAFDVVHVSRSAAALRTRSKSFRPDAARVLIGPGETAWTRIPRGPSSRAR